ncbi:hypothetical protein BgAZ_205510 [Babesia gibsoni]|uniref:Uncharacterized protein n=1 Tax=Babesia gibsoni TaxID=33632 RepID=A0AAD8LJ25_BABGI|nr:hypothetical protein BgAZ_205510 [Babesia gibsoni]
MTYINIGSFEPSLGDVVQEEPRSRRNNDSCKNTRKSTSISNEALRCKEIIEGFCVKSPGQHMEWKTEKVLIDVEVPDLDGYNSRNVYKSANDCLKLTGVLHTLGYASTYRLKKSQEPKKSN